MSEAWYRWDGPDLILNLHVQPRAARDELAGPHGNALKLRLTAPPLEGRANERLCSYLAALCGVTKSQVTVISGETGRAKRVRITSPRRLPPFVTAP